MKKRLFLILLALLAVVFVFSACGGSGDTDTETETESQTDTDTETSGQPGECVHNWVFTTGTATCTTGGTATFTCSLCQQTKNEANAAALGHDFQFVSRQDPTCIADGFDVYSCSRADQCKVQPEQRNKVVKSAKYHSFVANDKLPTCVDGGWTEKVCEHCEASSDHKTLAALGHTFERTYQEGEENKTETVVAKPTCEANGSITYKCAECTEVLLKTYEELTAENATDADKALAATIKAIGHDYTVENKVVKADCLTAGYTIYDCKNGCGTTTQSAITPALGHTYEREGVTEANEYKTVLEPTCITDGKKWAVCDDCDNCAYDDNATEYSRVIPADGEHDCTKPVGQIGATCFKQGYDIYKCTRDEKCSYTTQKNHTPVLKHDWKLDTSKLEQDADGNWYATCLTEGQYPYYCARKCGSESFNREGQPGTLIKHTKGEEGPLKPATCINSAEFKCIVCESVYNAYPDELEYQPNGEHKFDNLKQDVAATCKENGYKEYSCSRDSECTATKCQEFTPRIAHNYSPLSPDGIMTCQNEGCGESFIDTTTKIKSDFFEDSEELDGGSRLCDKDCTGAYCEIHNIIIQITASTSPAPAVNFEANEDGTEFGTKYEVSKDVYLIRVKGTIDTTYQFKLLDAEGKEIKSYEKEIGGTKELVNIVFNPEKDAEGYMIVDISDIADKVVKIEITSNESAQVSYYTDYEKK